MVLLNTGREMFAFSLFWLTYIVSITEGQQYNLTGSSGFAVLGEAFTWTCDMFIPPNDTASFVKFYRNNVLSVLIGSTGSDCLTQSPNPSYSYTCVSDRAYSLTIPAESMTEFEQGSIWRCEYPIKPRYRSPDITLRIAGQQYNLTGSSGFAVLGEAFTWTCDMFIPPNDTASFVKFYRNNVLSVLIGSTGSDCLTQSPNPSYSYTCVSDRAYSLTIPAESMTEFEQGSIWRCEYPIKPRYRSPDITLRIAGQQYNLTGSSGFAVLGEAFTWTCDMFIPPNDTASFVKFYRNNVLCVLIGSTGSDCLTQSPNPSYSYTCVSDRAYSLTIPAESMTEFEQGSIWRCEYHSKPRYRSPDITLRIAGEQYNLTGSSKFALLGETFTWTCRMFVPTNQTAKAVLFYRNNNLVVAIGHINNDCITQSANIKYTYTCLSDYVYTLTIPAENMTEMEQGSMWRCGYVGNSSYRSSDVMLKIAIDVHNVSFIPSDNPMTIREGTQITIQCAINRNAVPAPNITWYLGFTDITKTAKAVKSYITITGNRTDNTKTLECRATNNEKPSKTASTTLNVEYPPTIYTLPKQDIIEGRNLLVNCTATPGNPSATTFYWTKVENQDFRQNGAILQLYNTQRTSSGTYICTAENIYSNGGKGSDSQSMVVNVLYPPTLSTLSQQDIIEGNDLSLTCTVTPGNPSTTTFYWTKADNQGFRQNGPTLQLYNIQRTSSGTYRCIAENNYSNGERGTASQSMAVNVLYPPNVYTMRQQNKIEGRDLSVTCRATPGNPNSTTFYWTKVDNPGFRQNGSTLQLPNIQRTSSGTYRCTAENNYSNGERGTDSQAMVVNVQYQPTIDRRSLQIVNESEKISLTRDIVSNPVSTVSWYYGTQLLKTQPSVTTATYTIENTTCTDTKNYTLLVSNGIGNTVEALVELIVNCKPTPDISNITLAVTCTTGIEFSTTIIAYPEPQYELQYENGTRNDQMITTITENEVNNFTVQIRQHVVEKSSFGVYYLRASNMFGERTVIVNVIKQRKPDLPRNIEVTCKVTGAIVQWISSFNGGDTQNFTVITLSGHDGTSLYNGLNDMGENEIHVTYVSNLQPSVTYWFSVSAKNSYGSSSSKAISCTTVKALEKRNIDIKVDPNKETSNYTTIREQQEHTERNMYDELAPNENASQYEDILKKDNHGKNEKLYEKLQNSVDDVEEGKAIKMIPLKSKESSDDKSVTQKAEEYANTSFMK
nr:titin-like isoform X4 [Crassostrea gigas]